MFDKLHLLSQDVPEGGDGFRWKAHPYLRIAGSMPRGPAVFEWSARQRADLEMLWRDPTSDGARERLAKDLAVFCEKLGWQPDVKVLEDAEHSGEEYILTLSAVPPELYMLPWEVVQVGADGRYLSDYPSVQVRYAMPGLEARSMAKAPDRPGVLFAWSRAGGEVPGPEQAAAIRAAAEAGGVAFQEVADADEVSLQAALDAGAPSVLHLLCHGLPGIEGEPSRLSWGPADNPSEISATRLARLLRRYDSAIQLVVLSTCGGGDGHDNPMLLGSLAQELHRKGIRSVVASRYPLSTCGACVMTQTLYDKMLREAWSLERALRYTREALLRVADHGETHPGDAYGMQLYAYDTERFVSDNAVEAERPVLATYPFGVAARPVPSHAPPSTELTLVMEADPGLPEDELVAKLRRVAEDDQLTVAIPLGDARGRTLSVHTTADGAQRLLGAWRSKALHVAVGVAVGRLLLAKGVTKGLGSLFSALAGKIGAVAGRVGAGGHPGGIKVVGGKIGVTAARVAKATGQVAGKVGAAGQAGVAGQVVLGEAAIAGQAAAAGGAGKLAATAIAIAGKVVSAKVAMVAVLSAVAVVGGAELYRAETGSPAAAPIAATQDATAGSPGQRGAAASSVAHAVLVAEGPADPAPAPAVPTAAVPIAASPGTTAPAAPARIAAAAPSTAARAAGPETTTTAGERQPTAAPATGVAAEGATPADHVAGASGSGSTAAEPTVVASAEPAPDPTPAPAAISAPIPAAAAAVCGNGLVEAGEQCDDGNTRDGDGCSSKCTVEAKPVAIAPSALELQRVAGDTDVHPSKQTRSAMIRDGVSSVKGTVRLCVDAIGGVTETLLTEPTGYSEYDRKLIAAVRGWRFRPYVVNGQTFAVCSTAEFVYVPR
jgi:cysteine-rich repeat protein